jgi:hypothetical protein
MSNYYSENSGDSDEEIVEELLDTDDSYFDCISDSKYQMSLDCNFKFLDNFDTDTVIDTIIKYKYKYFSNSYDITKEEVILEEMYQLITCVLGEHQDILHSDEDLSSLYNQLKYPDHYVR